MAHCRQGQGQESGGDLRTALLSGSSGNVLNNGYNWVGTIGREQRHGSHRVWLEEMIGR